MIQINKGAVKVEGSFNELKAELTVLMKVLVEHIAFDKDDLEECVAMAFKSPDDIKKETIENFMKLMKKDSETAAEFLAHLMKDRDDSE